MLLHVRILRKDRALESLVPAHGAYVISLISHFFIHCSFNFDIFFLLKNSSRKSADTTHFPPPHGNLQKPDYTFNGIGPESYHPQIFHPFFFLGYFLRQGCISCGILVSGIRERGVSSEHMENMEMFSCSPTLVRSDSQRT